MASDSRKAPSFVNEKDLDSGTAVRTKLIMTPDEYQLATLGYKQTFVRSLGIVENWAATVNTMNFVSALPMMYGFAMYTGGPQAAFANWTMVGGLALMVSLSMAEIAATFPTCGGIYFWSFRLGGPVWGPFLSWFTAWFNWAGWVILIPGVAHWLLAISTILISFMANSTDRRLIKLVIRGTLCSAVLLLSFYWIWFPIKARGHFQPASVMTEFYNGIHTGSEKQASDAYCWIVGILYGAWDFYGFDAAVHLAEETKEASSVVARGMWLGTLVTRLISFPTLLLILFCTPSLTDIVNATYPNTFAAYLLSLIGPSGVATILVILWLDGILGTTILFLSAQRITYAIARDGILPFSSRLSTLSAPPHNLPITAGVLVLVLAVSINATVIASPVAFDALSAAATAIVDFSYLIPILARHSIGRGTFQPAEKWNLGRWSKGVASLAAGYICFTFVVLMLPQVYPVTAQSLNYTPVIVAGISFVSLRGWFSPFKLGARHWFRGPRKTISEADLQEVSILEDKDA